VGTPRFFYAHSSREVKSTQNKTCPKSA
jgi:hypothetical protein